VYVGVEACQIVVAVFQNNEDAVAIIEFAQQSSVFVVVQTVDIRVVPHLSSAQRRVAMTLQSDAVHLELRQQVALRGTPFDKYF
jgi:hypothetical protein